ncbi:hypothetical protein CR513_30459, partial [Mucuna pruriens]
MVPLGRRILKSNREWGLEGPEGVLINQVEYEALLAGMRLARKLEVKKLKAKSDSKLVTRQVNGEYQARDPQLTKYWERAMKMAFAFETSHSCMCLGIKISRQTCWPNWLAHRREDNRNI